MLLEILATCFSNPATSVNPTNCLVSVRRGTVMVLLGYFAMILVGLYEGKLLTQLLFYKVPSPINSLDELTNALAKGKLNMMARTTKWAYFEKVNRSDNYEFRCRFLPLCTYSTW